MGKLLSFEGRVKKSTEKKNRKSIPPMDRDTYHLWQLSQSIDQIITKGVIDQSLKTEEISAVLSHRLGTLIKTSENPDKLLAFCQALLTKLTQEEDSPHKAI